MFDAEDVESIKVVASGKAHRVGVKGSEPSFIEHHYRGEAEKKTLPINSHREAAGLVLDFVKEQKIPIEYIGHRFVHGGSFFSGSVFLNADTLGTLKMCLPLAPIHNPMSLNAIDECRKRMPDIPQYVTFDSAFHSSIPPRAYTYAISRRIVEKFGFRKYGFHGLSYMYVTGAAARFLEVPLETLNMVACHLGTGGSSVAAVKQGKSIDTSMGFSPLPGLIMSTRSGDVDPMLTVFLMSVYGYRSEDLETILNKQSGLLGISGFSSDIRDIINRFSKEEDDTSQAELAFKMYVHRLRKYIGSYIVALGGIDVLIFTDDIGVHNPLVREKVCDHLEWAGVKLNKDLNNRAITDTIHLISDDASKVKVLSIPTEEELVIVREGLKLQGGSME